MVALPGSADSKSSFKLLTKQEQRIDHRIELLYGLDAKFFLFPRKGDYMAEGRIELFAFAGQVPGTHENDPSQQTAAKTNRTLVVHLYLLALETRKKGQEVRVRHRTEMSRDDVTDRGLCLHCEEICLT